MIYLSTSPIIGSKEPIASTTSESIDPLTISLIHCRFDADDDLIFTFQGLPEPFDTIKKPNSHLDAYIAVYVSPSGINAP